MTWPGRVDVEPVDVARGRGRQQSVGAIREDCRVRALGRRPIAATPGRAKFHPVALLQNKALLAAHRLPIEQDAACSASSAAQQAARWVVDAVGAQYHGERTFAAAHDLKRHSGTATRTPWAAAIGQPLIALDENGLL